MDKYYKVIKSKNKHRKYLIYQHQDFRTCFENSKGLTEEYQDSINEHPEKVYAFDFDGTIADINHRVGYIKKPYITGKRDYQRFFEECKNDKPIEWIIDIMRMLPRENIYILSGRNGNVIHESVKWLEENNVPYNKIYMRYRTNYESDEILKLRMIDNGLKERIQWIVDDRQRVVDMWRENGLKVLQCSKWNES
jgi:phosphoglycolate phosphatase-like HAD superfamily hydrolase|tara:strand:- start:721 stop:1302 length:582 start_codon:yes stop_codon:yes gene_type:complete